jgi:hypothetical protein
MRFVVDSIVAAPPQFSAVWPSDLATLAVLAVDKYSRIYIATCADRCRCRSLENSIKNITIAYL